MPAADRNEGIGNCDQPTPQLNPMVCPREFTAPSPPDLSKMVTQRNRLSPRHPKRTRSAGGQIYAASLHERTTVIDSDRDASPARMRGHCDERAEWSGAMRCSHRVQLHPLAGCGSAAAVAIPGRDARFGKCRCRQKRKHHGGANRADHRLASMLPPNRLTFLVLLSSLSDPCERPNSIALGSYEFAETLCTDGLWPMRTERSFLAQLPSAVRNHQPWLSGPLYLVEVICCS